MLAMNQQIDYLKSKDVGFAMDNIIVVAIRHSKIMSYSALGLLAPELDTPRNSGGCFAFFVRNKTACSHDIKVLNIGDDYLETIGD